VSPGLSAYSGNGQITFEYQLTPSPLVVRAVDSSGVPLAGAPVVWSIAGGQGDLVAPVAKTDSNGFAMTDFLATAVPATASYATQTITATSTVGSATFTVTALAAGTSAVVNLIAPASGTALAGASGDELTGALKASISVAGGSQDGTPLVGVSVRLADANNPEAAPAAICANASSGEITTDAKGMAGCDLTLAGPPGSYSLAVIAGEQPATVNFKVTINAAATCTYSLSPGSASYGAGGGSGSVNISTSPACAWSASSNAGWVVLTSDADGIGPAFVSFTASTNNGPARTGTIDIAGQILTVSQAATGTSAQLAITTPAPLSDGSTQQYYSATLTANGGAPPYSWSAQGPLPPGLSLNPATGSISGSPLVTGTSAFQVTVTDSAGTTASLSFSITIEGFSGGVPGAYPSVQNTSLPPGMAGVGYLQTLNQMGGCTGALSPDPSFAISTGALPPGLVLREISPRIYAIAGVPGSPGTFPFTLAITDACGRAGHTNFSIAVSTPPVSASFISASPISAQFIVQQFDWASPPDQSIALSSSMPVSYLVSLAPGTGGGNWLSTNGPVAGSAPPTITLHVANYSTLAAGTYTANVVINPSGTGPPLLVPVTLTVTPSAAMMISPASVNVTIAANGGGGASTATQTLSVQAPATMAYSVSATTQSGGAWLSVSKTNGTTDDIFDVLANAASLPAGTYVGTVTISPTSAPRLPTQITVTLVVTTSDEVMPEPGGMTVVYRAGDSMPAAQSVLLGTLGDAPATFSVSADAPWVTVAPNAGSAPATITVAVDPTTLTPGAHYASIVVSTPAAANGQVSIPVTVFVPTPISVILSVQNAASYTSGAVAPGEAVVIYGSYLGEPFLDSGTAANGIQTTNLSSVQVTFNGVAAPILYARTDVVSAMVPFSVVPGNAVALQVSFEDRQSDPFSLSTAPAAPGIFTSGPGQAIAVNVDGSLNGPGHGASPGDVIGIYMTGGGTTSPPSNDGQIAVDTSQALVQQVHAQVNGIDSTVIYAGNAPGLIAGVSLVKVQLPAGLPPSAAASITVSVGGVTTQTGVTVYIAP
jgi:uncharacterized protein (TIGR03437 family)